jgi:tetratricopeptide (TPR) repeat protein
MKKLLLFILVAFGFSIQYSFAQTVAELQKNAQAFMRQGDYTNAVLILNRCIEKEPTNTSVGKDLALSYFYTQNNSKALEVIKPVLESNDADDQCFLIAGNIYKQLELPKESEKVYKKGIVKFPESGPIYNELGQIQIATGSRDAIKNWEKGIKADPSYSKNYYNAARFYFFEKDYVWSILYCEIFANMEPNNNLVSEIKKMLLESYKQMFLDTDLDKNNKSKNAFVGSYLGEIKKQTGVLSNGINAETLFMIRSRFIIDWFATNNKPAFRLFDYQQQLLKAGMFEAYNQWLFGITENLGAYQVWVKTNAEENNAFLSFQKSRIFKIPVGQYYH